MSQNAIKLEGIGKQYHIGRKQGGHRSLQDVVTDTFVSPFRRAGRLLRGQAMTAADLDQSFWALRDVSLEVQHGGITSVVQATGTINPLTTVPVGSYVSGTVQYVFADFNSRVEAGQVLAQLDPEVYQAQVVQARGIVRQPEFGRMHQHVRFFPVGRDVFRRAQR